MTEHEETASREKLKTKWATLEALVGAPERIRQVARTSSPTSRRVRT